MQKAGSEMSVEARIMAALAPFGDPVEKSLLYAAANKRPPWYYTFLCQSFGTDFGDDAPGHERWLIQVHFFAPLGKSCLEQVRQTKRALFDAGFTWPDMVDATDQDGQHYVLECETAAPLEMEAE